MALNNGEVLYGLRNLVTGDEEETRIESVISEVSQKVHDLIKRGHHHLAYRVAIRESGIKMTREECYEWARWFLDGEEQNVYDEVDQLADEMYEMYLSIQRPDSTALSHHKIDDVEYLFVVDEGFSPAWPEQIVQVWGDCNGPFYIYPTNDKVLTLVSRAPMTEDQRYAAEHPENSKM